MKNKELHYFIGSCLALGSSAEDTKRLETVIREKPIGWNRFVSVCSNNLVLQTLFVKFRDHKLLDSIPPDLADYLQEIYELNLERNRQILLQIAELNRALNHSDIRPIYIKGAGNLIDNLYGDKGERILADIDLLVDESDFLKAAAVVEAMGYSTLQHSWEEVSQMMHFPTFHKAGMPAPVEIHRAPVMLGYSRGLNAKMVSEEKKAAKGLEGCDVPSDRHKAHISFIHSQLSNKGNISGRVSMRDLYDLWLLSQRLDLKEAFDAFPYRGKAKSYLLLMDLLFGTHVGTAYQRGFSDRVFLMHFNLNLSSRFYYTSFKYALSLFELVFVSYLGRIPAMLFNPSLRRSTFRKLASREWYKTHFSTFKERFR